MNHILNKLYERFSIQNKFEVKDVPRYYKFDIVDEHRDSTCHHEAVEGSRIDVIEMQLQCHKF